jgi:hypothetical protein
VTSAGEGGGALKIEGPMQSGLPFIIVELNFHRLRTVSLSRGFLGRDRVTGTSAAFRPAAKSGTPLE